MVQEFNVGLCLVVKWTIGGNHYEVIIEDSSVEGHYCTIQHLCLRNIPQTTHHQYMYSSPWYCSYRNMPWWDGNFPGALRDNHAVKGRGRISCLFLPAEVLQKLWGMSTLVEFALLLFFLNASYESEHLTSKSFRVIFHAIFIIRILTYIQIRIDKKNCWQNFSIPFHHLCHDVI